MKLDAHMKAAEFLRRAFSRKPGKRWWTDGKMIVSCVAGAWHFSKMPKASVRGILCAGKQGQRSVTTPASSREEKRQAGIKRKALESIQDVSDACAAVGGDVIKFMDVCAEMGWKDPNPWQLRVVTICLKEMGYVKDRQGGVKVWVKGCESEIDTLEEKAL